MRIDIQGLLQSHAPYSHVGYVSADLGEAFVRGGIHLPPYLVALYAAWALVIVLLVRAHFPKDNPRRKPLTYLALVLVLGLVVPFYVNLSFYANLLLFARLDPRFLTTLQRLEPLQAQTLAWTEAHGKSPTIGEWQAMHPSMKTLDGWGKPFVYYKPQRDRPIYRPLALSPSELTDRYSFAIQSEGEHPTIVDWYLGPDGLYGTTDDTSQLLYVWDLLAGYDGRKHPARRQDLPTYARRWRYAH